MNYILSILFSAIDFSSLIILTLCAFRFRIKIHAFKIATTSLIMAVISNGFALLNISSVYPIIQLLLLIIVFKLFFKESLLYSFVSNVLGFVLFAGIEMIYFQILINSNLISASDMGGAANNTTYMLELSESILMCLVGFCIKKLNQGFGFTEDTRLSNNSIKTKNKYFVIVSTLTISIMFILFDIILSNKVAEYLMFANVVLIILTIILIYLFNKRDKEHYN